MANRLGQEKSPYLLQHKDNPVDWYSWCEEAFQKAAKEDKPIFLSIGYSTCHWCHVMERESFEDPQIAALLQPFVCIKVDREERPDIDAVYMAACQALTGTGGWPLTIFMTPEQKPFFAGTYFPKTSRHGQPGLSELLWQIAYLWRTARENLLESGNRIAAALAHVSPISNSNPDKRILKEAFQLLHQSFDSAWGGFGRAPKFPTPHNLLFLMRYSKLENNETALQMAETTLQAIAAGGIFDHIGGGFSRYATDKKWLIPHFEKMLYDNTLLMLAYLEAFQLTQNPAYAQTARRTADYILRELTHPDGGFYCGQDADSEGVEGKYYALTPDEIVNVLGEADGKEFCQLYHITPAGNFEGKSIPNRIGQTGDSWKDDDPRLRSLLAYRQKRTQLNLDRKILLSWNAWTIIAMARAGIILNNSKYLNAAVKAQAFIAQHMTNSDNRLYLRFCDGEAAHTGQLDDYAVYTLALTELYRATFDIRYLEQAVQWAEQMRELFEDKAHAGYYITAHDAEVLINRPKETYDGAIPSGNSVAAMVLERLAGLTGVPAWRTAADRQQEFMAGQAKDSPAAHCFALLAMVHTLYPQKELLCTGDRPPVELADYLRTHPAVEVSILFKTAKNEKRLSALAPFTNAYPASEQPVWYLCKNGACHAPETDFNKLKL